MVDCQSVNTTATTTKQPEHTYRKNLSISISGIISISISSSRAYIQEKHQHLWYNHHQYFDIMVYLAYAIPVHHNSLCLRSSLLPRAPGPSGTKLICVFLKIQIDTQIQKYTKNANTNRNTSSTLPLHCHSLRLHH